MKSHLVGPFYALLGAMVVAALSLCGVSPATAAAKPASITSVGSDYDLAELGIGTNLVLGSDDRTAYFTIGEGFGTVDLQTMERGASILSGKVGGKFVLSQDGKMIYAVNRQYTGIDAISTVPNPDVRKALPDRKNGYDDFAVSPDGKTLAAIGRYPRSLVIADTATGELIDTSFQSADQDLLNVWFSPDGRFLHITAQCDLNVCTKLEYSILVVDTESWETVRSIPTNEWVDELIFSPNSKKVYAANGYGEITVIETQTGKVTKTLHAGEQFGAAVLAANGTKLLVGVIGSLSLIEIDVATDTISGQTNSLAPGSTTRLLAPKSGNKTYAVKNLPRGGDVLSEITVTDVKPSVSTDRVSGRDRYETAVAISVSGNWTANTVYVASGEQFPDALAAGPAATAERAPLLLTKAKFLPPVVREEILRLKPTKIIVVGSAGAVSDSVFQELKGMVPNTIRRGGPDRYATARAVVAGAFTYAPYVSFATGIDYPDAMSAGAVEPVLLVRPGATKLEPATRSLLQKLGTTNSKIIGSAAVVSAGFERALTAALFNPVRYGGKDRFETNRLANKANIGGNDRVYFASGFDFPDGLAVSASLPWKQGFLYLVRPNCIPAETKRAYVGTHAEQRVTLVGSSTVVGNEVAFGKTC